MSRIHFDTLNRGNGSCPHLCAFMMSPFMPIYAIYAPIYAFMLTLPAHLPKAQAMSPANTAPAFTFPFQT